MLEFIVTLNLMCKKVADLEEMVILTKVKSLRLVKDIALIMRNVDVMYFVMTWMIKNMKGLILDN